MMIRRGMWAGWAGMAAAVGVGLGLPAGGRSEDPPKTESSLTARPEPEPALFDIVRQNVVQSVRVEQHKDLHGLVIYVEPSPSPTGLLPAFGECFIQTQKSNAGKRVLPQAA